MPPSTTQAMIEATTMLGNQRSRLNWNAGAVRAGAGEAGADHPGAGAGEAGGAHAPACGRHRRPRRSRDGARGRRCGATRGLSRDCLVGREIAHRVTVLQSAVMASSHRKARRATVNRRLVMRIQRRLDARRQPEAPGRLMRPAGIASVDRWTCPRLEPCARHRRSRPRVLAPLRSTDDSPSPAALRREAGHTRPG